MRLGGHNVEQEEFTRVMKVKALRSLMTLGIHGHMEATVLPSEGRGVLTYAGVKSETSIFLSLKILTGFLLHS